MKLVSFNVRGLGSVLKRKEIGKLVRMEHPDFLFLQETKLEKVDDHLCRMMWDSRDFGWEMKESIGASGGLLCFWNKVNFTKTGDSTGDGYLRITGEWGIQKVKYNLVNVYGPNDRQKRLKLWDELRIMITEEGGRWLIAGDFNAIRCLEERRGRIGESPDMKDFDGFIQSAGLIDIKMVNRRFTWYRPDGTAMSRLDRVLMNAEMYSMGVEWVQQGLKRNISDHCAIVLKKRTVDWGPRPFRVLDAWQLHPNFKKVIEQKWSAMEVEEFAGYKCKQKLKKLKEFLKGWNQDEFGDMEAQYEQAVKKVELVDLKNEDFDLDDYEILQRQEGFQNMWDILRKREVIWKQKSRSKWVREGDANTRFFHRIANGRKAQNHITGLWCDGCWVEEPIQVKKEVVNYFSKLFQADTWNRPKPYGVNFKQISTEDKQWLERPFSIEEIEEGLRSCEGSKAPGPDGYNFSFLKFAWNSLKEDFMSFFKEFHRNGRLVSGLNSSFLTLIPKKLNAGNLKDYRPISLIGCMYKLLSKVLANRLKAVLPGIISESQSAFLGGRQLVDGVLVLNEVVEEVKRRKQSAFIFKADFAKAYDCVDWTFLEWMMDRLGFGIKWKGWIMECLSTSKISVLINGSPTEEFKAGKGLRQGDPLSPFLFLMIGEGLNGLVQKAVSEGMLRGIEIGRRGLAISLLQFADDTIIMGKAATENIFMVKTILRWFELMSGLQINFSKSNIYGYNVPARWVEGSASMLHCGVGKSHFCYLGMPVDGNPGNKKLWEPLVNKFRAKLAVWKAASLSFGGRLTLLNSVLSALPIFYMSLFLIPNSVMIELISIQRNFLWGGVEGQRKISWVKWDKVCGSKVKGGLGVTDLRRKNWALLGKWWYRFGEDAESLWKRIVTEKYYGGNRDEADITAVGNWRTSRICKNIISIGGRSRRLKNMLVEGFRWEVGEGNRVSFWRDLWAGNKNLRDLCPRLYELSKNKLGNISDMGVWEGEKWSWKMDWRRGRIGREKDEDEVLWERLDSIQLKKGVTDFWRWVHDSEGNFKVRKAYEFLAPTESILEDQLSKLIWCRLVPSKVSFFGWRLCLDRLPTKWNIMKRGVFLQEEELMCGLCGSMVEEANHLFCMCKEAWIIWVEVLKWWGMETVMPNNVLGVADIFVQDVGRIIGKEMGACIFLTVSWYLWYWRNGKVFNSGDNIRGRLVDMVQAKSFFWIKNKIQGCVFSFHEWKLNPVECASSMRRYKRELKLVHKQQKGMATE
ncbi:hypothetical protein SLE2022_051990 [Rubroshorea leprosula]